MLMNRDNINLHHGRTLVRAWWMWCALSLLFIMGVVLFASGRQVQGDSPLLMALGGLLIFLLPGLYWGEALGVRSRHPLETVALGFVITTVIGLILLPIPFLLKTRIDFWIWLLLLATALGMFLSAWRLRTRKRVRFWRTCLKMPTGNIGDRILHIVLVVAPFALAVSAWRWGEDLFDISTEKLLHLMFVRYYHDLPLVFENIGVLPGMPPANLVNLWEFWVAAWARVAGLDLLDVFFRARCVIPIFGLSGLYLLIREIWPKGRDAAIVFALSIVMALAGAVLRNPSTINWAASNDSMQLRWVTCFMGTVHHSDSAMDILLPLGAGLALWAGRRFNFGRYLLLGLFLFACILWHPREFFQLTFYAGIAGVTLLLCVSRRRLLLRRWGSVMFVFLTAAVLFAVLTTVLVRGDGIGYDEL